MKTLTIGRRLAAWGFRKPQRETKQIKVAIWAGDLGGCLPKSASVQKAGPPSSTFLKGQAPAEVESRTESQRGPERGAPGPGGCPAPCTTCALEPKLWTPTLQGPLSRLCPGGCSAPAQASPLPSSSPGSAPPAAGGSGPQLGRSWCPERRCPGRVCPPRRLGCFCWVGRILVPPPRPGEHASFPDPSRQLCASAQGLFPQSLRHTLPGAGR